MSKKGVINSSKKLEKALTEEEKVVKIDKCKRLHNLKTIQIIVCIWKVQKRNI